MICPCSGGEGCDRPRSERTESALSESDAPTPVQRSWICHQNSRSSGRCRARPLWGGIPTPQPVTKQRGTIPGTWSRSNKVCPEQLSPKAPQEGICSCSLPVGCRQSEEIPECSSANAEGTERQAGSPQPPRHPQLPHSSSPHTLPVVFVGQHPQQVGKDPLSPLHLAGSSARRGLPPSCNLAIITHSFFF